LKNQTDNDRRRDAICLTLFLTYLLRFFPGWGVCWLEMKESRKNLDSDRRSKMAKLVASYV
jgi:hypothetical protein